MHIMQPLSPVYLAALAVQLGSLSAFLGGFAATYLATLLTLGQRGRGMAAAIALAAVAAVAFVVATVGSTMLVATLHPNAPPQLAATATFGRRAVTALSFAAGMYALLLSIACSGWVRSRRTGIVTTAVAGVGIVLVTYLAVDIG